ncbi:glycosyltransferase [Planctomycetota bacterium]
MRIFVRECRSLAEAGYEVHLVIATPTAGIKDGIHLQPIPRYSSRGWRMLIGPWIALRAALKTKAQLYHYHDPELIGMGFILRWFMGKKVVFDIHECVHRQIRSKPYLPQWASWLVAGCYRLLEKILTVGQIKIVANEHSVQDYRNPTLVQNFPRLTRGIVPTKERFNKGSVPSLVYVGNVAEIRGALVYVELARRLLEQGQRFTMTLMGEHTSEFDTELRQKIGTYGLDDCVTVTGRQDWYRAMELVSKATIGLCLLLPVPNYTTCLATKIIEYMMLGTPVLASNFDCWRPFVEGEKVGMMANPLDLDDVYTACKKMLDDRESLTEMSERGRQAVAQRYHWEQEFKKLQTCYARVLDSDQQ